MASDGKQPGANLASGSVVMAALVAAGTSYFVSHEASLQGSRPAMTEPQFHQAASSQDIEARLWQDPFAAVAKAIEKAGLGKSERCGETSDGASRAQSASHCVSPLAKVDDATLEKTQVVAVTMPGAPYAEDGEVRRRTRYAVSSSLERAGFAPRDEHHLGYFRPQDQNVQLPEVVPYEWFASSPADRRPTHYVLVLWINEDALRGNPLWKLSSLVAVPRQDKTDSKRDVPVRIVGPYSSDILLAMAKEVGPGDLHCMSPPKPPAEEWQGRLKSMSFYTYGATVDDKELFKAVQHCDTPQDSSVHDFFKNRGITLYRTIATDDVLARGIVNEFERRRITVGGDSKDHVALISEWDTFYGQTLPETMERNLAYRPFRPCGHCVHRLTYMRGLDGQLPGTQGNDDRKTGKETGEADKQTSVAGFFKTHSSDVKDGDRPNGQGQQDYLRRLAGHLRKIDDKLHRDNEGRIRAIGILGSDVFDKLLVLRALQPEFPEALFFTTDLDATLTMPSELDFTRNLIISSSFGSELRPEIQGEIPPFRSSYQTSAFLATSLAVRAPNDGDSNFGQARLTGWLSQARVFEIERTGAVLPFPQMPSSTHPLNGNAPRQNGCEDLSRCSSLPLVASNGLWERRSVSGIDEMRRAKPIATEHQEQKNCERDLTSCDDIQPPKENLYPKPEGLELIARTLAGATLLLLLTLCIRRVRERASVEIGLVSLIIGAAAAACYNWEALAKWLTEDGRGEPIALLQGVSVWPTVLLRALSAVLSIYLLWRAWRKLDKNLYEIAEELHLPMPNLAIAAERELAKGHSLWKNFVRMFSYGLRERQPDLNKPYNIDIAWCEYVYQGRWAARMLRVVVYTAAMFCLWRYVVSPMMGRSILPWRGELSETVYRYTSRVDIICMLAVMYLVFDATLLCLRFVKEMCRSSTEWPAATKAQFEGRLGLEHQIIDKWIDLDFVAKRTRCISALIYYPFILIALVLVTRSTVFANYTPNLKILVFQGTCLTIVFGCAIALCWAAQSMRSAAKQKLMDGIICAKGPRAKDLDDGGSNAEQLETLLVRLDELREGAFSPLTQQPLVRALLLPAGSLGWTALLENGMLPGL